jgi:hypothetical protein
LKSEASSRSEVALSVPEVEYILSPRAIRDQARVIFDRTVSGQGHFHYHEDKLAPTVALVLEVTKKNYPDLNIPFHSRWGHFRVGGVDRVKELDAQIAKLDRFERARRKLDLVVPSVLLDAGSGPAWKFRDGTQILTRSEGLGVASLRLFMAGALSGDRNTPRTDAAGLAAFTVSDLMDHFQVSDRNPLVGLEGRVQLLKNLGHALSNREIFGPGARPGGILDCLRKRCGDAIPAPAILKVVLEGLGPIWPGRLMCRGVNLGDVWRHTQLDATSVAKSLVPLHKLSQWMTYSLIEPLLEAGLTVTGVEELTGLAEYRNGGLFLDSGLLTLRHAADGARDWKPDSDLLIEWRALTVHLLDLVGAEVQKALGKTPAEFPLAKVLEGGTWWAGRRLAQEKRNGLPPLNIISDGTVF